MMQKSIGDLLTEARVKKGLQLVDIAKDLDIDAQYLLIMELGQFSLIPSDRLEEYLTRYATAVNLDGKSLLNKYYNKEVIDDTIPELLTEELLETESDDTSSDDTSDTLEEENSVSDAVESEAVYTIFRDSLNNKAQNNHNQLNNHVEKNNPLEEMITPLLVEEEPSTPLIEEDSFEEDTLSNQDTMIAPAVFSETSDNEIKNKIPSKTSRKYRSKNKREEKRTSSFLPIILLSLLAVGIVVFIGYFVINQVRIPFISTDNNPSSSVSETSSSETTATNEQVTTTEASNEPINNSTQTNLVVTGGGDSLSVNVKNGTRPVEVVISLDDVESSWVSLTNSSLDEGGILLDDQNTSYTAILTEGTTSAELTLGVSRGVNVTVNGEQLDTSLLEGSPSYITFTIE
ncbi:helix-turn-helix domain-containing protein [Streptococcus marimammalium]|uniref:helix-turn-helix domain-containing protein n=1 Tax=Streptococcus marimammalium TaxID=269666 RepID=UPI0003714D0A|nr:helix-turn-helix transcriptional regulator [Streptococcus marimammalium]